MMEKFLLIFCVVVLLTIVQGLITNHKGSDILVKNVIDRLVQQHGNEDPKRNIYTAINEEIPNVDDKDGVNVFIDGIQTFIKAKRLVHAGFGIVKRSGYDDLHARGTSTTPKPTAATTTPPESMPTTVAVATTKAQTTPVSTTTTTTTAPKTLGPIIELPPFRFCKYMHIWMPCRRNGGRSHGRRRWPFKR